jgi:hypothetical protein
MTLLQCAVILISRGLGIIAVQAIWDIYPPTTNQTGRKNALRAFRVLINMALKSFPGSLSDTSEGDSPIVSVRHSNLFADISRL